ncbi:DNA-binding protein [Pseudomonas sp. TUM22785]|uniref:DNA-binding protein n=1 Tax=Pseudomonas sp. TUM22785 TaxID=3019098 RepID=UPI0023065778|nr:DNA-binding protein [Pseudomonas sp. TUM22785]WCD79614.1 DNA-binding protein [Pseudomonas sp. TUM22785]
MSEGITQRAMQLLEMASITELSEAGSTGYVRWQNIKRGRARLGADEIGILSRVFPQYQWWLISGELRLQDGQTSPEHDGLIAPLSLD